MRVVKWSVVVLLVALLVGGGWVYYQASRVPADYAFTPLTPTERQQAAKDFVSRLADFNRYAQNNEPFSWSIDEVRINRYLASLEEIAAVRPGHKAGAVTDALQRAGLADPAVALKDGQMLLMVRSTEYDKVVTIGIEMEFTGDRRLRVRLQKAAVGELELPESWVQDRLATLKNALSEKLKAAPDKDSSTNPTGKVAEVLAAVLKSINEEPFDPVGTWDRRRIRVHDITVTPGRLTLQVRRVPQ